MATLCSPKRIQTFCIKGKGRSQTCGCQFACFSFHKCSGKYSMLSASHFCFLSQARQRRQSLGPWSAASQRLLVFAARVPPFVAKGLVWKLTRSFCLCFTFIWLKIDVINFALFILSTENGSIEHMLPLIFDSLVRDERTFLNNRFGIIES